MILAKLGKLFPEAEALGKGSKVRPSRHRLPGGSRVSGGPRSNTAGLLGTHSERGVGVLSPWFPLCKMGMIECLAVVSTYLLCFSFYFLNE